MACLCETKVNLKRVGIFCKIFVAIFVTKGGRSFTKSRLKVCSWGKKRDKKTCFKDFGLWILFVLDFVLCVFCANAFYIALALSTTPFAQPFCIAVTKIT